MGKDVGASSTPNPEPGTWSLDPSCGTRGSQETYSAPLELSVIYHRSWAASGAGLGCAKRTWKTGKSAGENELSPADFPCFPLPRSSHPFPPQLGGRCLSGPYSKFASRDARDEIPCRGLQGPRRPLPFPPRAVLYEKSHAVYPGIAIHVIPLWMEKRYF